MAAVTYRQEKEKMRKIFKKILKRCVRKLYENPPPVNENQLVFLSSPDFADNGRAFFEYLVENGYNDRYKIYWLVDYPEKYKHIRCKNVKFIRRKHQDIERITYKAHKTVLTSRYVIFTHSIYWVRKVQEGQTYLNLWHGCGYKGQKAGGSDKIIYFDYALVTSEMYRKHYAEFLNSTEDKMLPIGFPRLDWFYTDKTNARRWIRELKEGKKADKAIIWMPTFRKSGSERLSDDTVTGELGLPLVNTVEEMKRIDELCCRLNTVIIIKKHFLQVDYPLNNEDYRNIEIIDNEFIEDKNINLYELVAGSDAMISDYSSIAAEYLLLDRPLAFVLDDLKTYETVRPFFFDNPQDYMPGEHVFTMDDFEGFIVNVAEGKDEYGSRRAAMREIMMNPCDCYSRRVADYFNL